MIVEEKSFSVKCDGTCGNHFYSDYFVPPSIYKTDSRPLLIEIIESYEWKKIKGKWYCPECWEESEVGG